MNEFEFQNQNDAINEKQDQFTEFNTKNDSNLNTPRKDDYKHNNDQNIINNNLANPTERLLQTKPQLQLTIENSTSMPKGTMFIITPSGPLSSENKHRLPSSPTVFGYLEDTENNNSIDFFLLPNIFNSLTASQEIIQKNTLGVFFKIEYDQSSMQYSLSDLGNGYGTFVQLTKPFDIKENTLINIGDSYLVFSFGENSDRDLNLKMYSGNYEYQPQSISGTTEKTITIGRDDKCDVVLNDKMLSRVHCVLKRDKDEWKIIDGKGDGGRSMNGTWVFAFDNMTIDDGMVFKSNSNLISCKYIY